METTIPFFASQAERAQMLPFLDDDFVELSGLLWVYLCHAACWELRVYQC